MIEWNYYARILLEYDSDATFWDLLEFVYTDLVGKFPIKETDEQYERVEELFLEGHSFKEISQLTGVSYTNVIGYVDGIVEDL